MAEEGGYDYDVVDKQLFNEFYCPVCFKLMKDAVELQCGHSLCSSCLDNWKIKAGEMNRPFHCPQCRMSISTEEVKQNKTINRMIKSSIRVKCTDASDGCEWVGVVGDVQEHLDKVCSYTVVNCAYKNCEDRFPRGCLAEHLPTCVYRSMFCEHCKESLVWNQMKEHLLKCDLFPVYCDNNGCQVLSVRCLISKHQEEDCEYVQIKCQYASVGCQAKFLRRQQEDHDKKLITTHMALLLQNNHSVNKELEATKEELISTTQRLENIEKRLKASNKEMEDTKQRLANTEKCLKVSNEKIEKIKQRLKNTEQSHCTTTGSAKDEKLNGILPKPAPGDDGDVDFYNDDGNGDFYSGDGDGNFYNGDGDFYNGDGDFYNDDDGDFYNDDVVDFYDDDDNDGFYNDNDGVCDYDDFPE